MRRSFVVGWVALLAACVASSVASANVRLPKIFSSHMLLQRGLEAPVWGWADAGEEVTVQFAGQSKVATADANGTPLGAEPVAIAANHEQGPYVVLMGRTLCAL